MIFVGKRAWLGKMRGKKNEGSLIFFGFPFPAAS